MRKQLSISAAIAIAWTLLWSSSFLPTGAGEFNLKDLPPVTLVVASMGTGSQIYAQANAMNPVFLRYLPKGSYLDIQTTSSGTTAGFLLVGNGQADIGFSQPVVAREGFTTGVHGNPPMTNVRGVVGGLEDTCGFTLFTKAFVDKTGFKTFDEVVAKKYPINLVTKAIGSLGEATAAKVLATYGLTYDDIVAWGGTVTHTDSSNVVDMLRDNRANVCIESTSQTQANWMELTMTSEVHYAPYNEKTIKELTSQGYLATILPKGAYNGQVKEDYMSLSIPSCLLIDEKVGDEYVYLITKAMCENKEELVSLFNGFWAFDPKTAGLPSKLGVPIHPGAKRYFDEVGYPTSE